VQRCIARLVSRIDCIRVQLEQLVNGMPIATLGGIDNICNEVVSPRRSCCEEQTNSRQQQGKPSIHSGSSVPRPGNTG
jgi:hypothetical protein